MPGVYPYDATTLANITLALQIDDSAYNASTNPFGIRQGGHIVRFVQSLDAVADIANSIAAASQYTDGRATAAAASAVASALSSSALSGTSTTSVAIGAGALSFVTQAGKSFDVGTYATAISAANPTTHWVSGQVTAYNSGTGALTLTVPAGSFSGSGSRADWLIYGRAGVPGASVTGPAGAIGPTTGIELAYSNGITDTDPGNGIFTFSSLTFATITTAYIDNIDRFSNSISANLDTFDDTGKTTDRGRLTVVQVSDPSKRASFIVTGSVVDGTGYRKVSLTPIAGGVLPTNGQICTIGFTPTGLPGADGVGAGTVIGDTVSVDGRVVLYAGTTGQHIKDSLGGIGTSGHNLGWLDGNNTTSGNNTHSGIETFSNDIIVPDQADGANTTKAASTKFVQRALAIVPTPPAGDNDTSLATTAYVQGELTRPNLAIEGQFDCWQYGTSVGDTGGVAKFVVDRWKASRFGTATNAYTVSRQNAAAGSGVKYKVRVQRDSGNTFTQIMTFYTALSTDDSRKFAGKTLTISFSITAGANYSAAASSLQSRIETGTGTDQGMDGVPALSWTGGATGGNFSDQFNTISTTRTRFSQTFAVPSTATQIGFAFMQTPVGTAGAADYFEVDSVKWEIGSSATLFVPADIDNVIKRCYWYYEDLGMHPLTGVRWLRVIGHGHAGATGGGVGTTQTTNFVVKFLPKRSFNYTTDLPTSPATSIHLSPSGTYDLTLTDLAHTSLTDNLYQANYTIDAGSHPALTIRQSFIIAIDGGTGSRFAINNEL